MTILCGVRPPALTFLILEFITEISIGIAYTIDPIYEAEVRDYLGTWRLQSFSFKLLLTNL